MLYKVALRLTEDFPEVYELNQFDLNIGEIMHNYFDRFEITHLYKENYAFKNREKVLEVLDDRVEKITSRNISQPTGDLFKDKTSNLQMMVKRLKEDMMVI